MIVIRRSAPPRFPFARIVPIVIGMLLGSTQALAVSIQVDFTGSLTGTLGNGSIDGTLGTYILTVPGSIPIDPNQIAATVSGLPDGFDGSFARFQPTDPGVIDVPVGYPEMPVTIANLANVAVTYDFTSASFNLSLSPGAGGGFETPSVVDVAIGGAGATAFGPIQITSTTVPESTTAALVSMGVVFLAIWTRVQRRSSGCRIHLPGRSARRT